jgi:hypothetical protein
MNFEEELELLQAAYSEEEIEVRLPESDRAVLYKHKNTDGSTDVIQFVVPKGYPTQANITKVSVTCKGLSKLVSEELKRAVLEECTKSVGEPTLFNTITEYANIRADMMEVGTVASSSSSSSSSNGGGGGGGVAGDSYDSSQDAIARCLVHFHHIMADSKKAFIKEEASLLDLGGVWCSGFPGCVVVEGLKRDVDEYLKGLRGLRWQEMTVRGEELNQSERLFTNNPGLEKVEKLSDIAKQCKDRGLEDLYNSIRKN